MQANAYKYIRVLATWKRMEIFYAKVCDTLFLPSQAFQILRVEQGGEIDVKSQGFQALKASENSISFFLSVQEAFLNPHVSGC